MRSNKNLFLVCPTDSMEVCLRRRFRGEAFFYTALGVYFEFDMTAQYKLWEIIDENSINQLTFVSRIDNIFYQQAFNKHREDVFSVDIELKRTNRNISKHLISFVELFPNFYFLAAQHLANQKKRLLSTSYLGDQLRAKKVTVNAYVYQEHEQVFYSLEEVLIRGRLLSSISAN